MSNRTAVIVSAAAAALVSIFGITSLTAQTATPPDTKETTSPEDQCLAGPKATTPPGGHWYYRIEKGTKRKCWYLGDAGAKVNKAAAEPSSTGTSGAEAETTPSPRNPMQKSVANARAELTAASPDEDPSLAETTWPPLSPTTDSAARPDDLRQDDQTAAIQPAPQPSGTQGWNIASRWPEAGTVASADAPPVKNSSEPAPSTAVPTPGRLVATATPAPAATPAAAVQTNAATGSNDGGAFSIRIVLALLVCALALAAIVGPMIFNYVRPRARKRHRAGESRRPIWDMDITRERVRQDNPRTTSPAPYADPLPEPRVLDEAVDELESLLARAARRSAA